MSSIKMGKPKHRHQVICPAMLWRWRDTVWAGAGSSQFLSQAILLSVHVSKAELVVSGSWGSQRCGGVSEDAGEKGPLVTTTRVPTASKADRAIFKKPCESHMSDHIANHQDHKSSK